MVEAVDKHFCKRNYPGEKTNIYKPYHNLAYTGDDLKLYSEITNFAKVRGDEASMQRVVAALKSVDECKDIDEHVDVESVMKYMALQTIVVNYDCMTGKNVQNYYLREADGKISLIPWDYNLSWGGYPDDGDDFEGFGDFDPEKWKAWFNSLSQEQRDSMQQAFSQQQWIDVPMTESSWSKEDVSKIVNFPIDTPFTSKLSKRTFFKRHTLNMSLEEVENQLDPLRFMRVNRQFIISAAAVQKLSTYFLGKMRIHMTAAPNEEIIISKDKVATVKRWLDS
jgi:hypothetical protein